MKRETQTTVDLSLPRNQLNPEISAWLWPEQKRIVRTKGSLVGPAKPIHLHRAVYHTHAQAQGTRRETVPNALTDSWI